MYTPGTGKPVVEITDLIDLTGDILPDGSVNALLAADPHYQRANFRR
jgi:hypothetical protein